MSTADLCVEWAGVCWRVGSRIGRCGRFSDHREPVQRDPFHLLIRHCHLLLVAPGSRRRHETTIAEHPPRRSRVGRADQRPADDHRHEPPHRRCQRRPPLNSSLMRPTNRRDRRCRWTRRPPLRDRPELHRHRTRRTQRPRHHDITPVSGIPLDRNRARPYDGHEATPPEPLPAAQRPTEAARGSSRLQTNAPPSQATEASSIDDADHTPPITRKSGRQQPVALR